MVGPHGLKYSNERELKVLKNHRYTDTQHVASEVAVNMLKSSNTNIVQLITLLLYK